VESEQVDLPWRKKITVNTGFLPVTLAAYGPPGNEISCRISVDGRETASATGDGVVTCIGIFDR
jgi:hypothetical protein